MSVDTQAVSVFLALEELHKMIDNRRKPHDFKETDEASTLSQFYKSRES